MINGTELSQSDKHNISQNIDSLTVVVSTRATFTGKIHYEKCKPLDAIK